MPRKKPERTPPPNDDGFSTAMRERLRNLKLQAQDPSRQRSVRESKAEDLISAETENAKISGLNAVWYMDRLTDQARTEEINPDAHVLRRKYDDALQKLEEEPSNPSSLEKALDADVSAGKGFLEVARVQDIDELFASAGRPPQPSTSSRLVTDGAEVPPTATEAEPGDDGIAEYLSEIQKRSSVEDKTSRRVVKSPVERRKEYEASKLQMYAVTAALGAGGSIAASGVYGADSAFSFGLGSLGALLYLSALSDYADNAETPLGNALGGRRYLVPVVLVLLVTQWYKVEAVVPGVASLELQPQLLPALLGFFLYSVGKVVGNALPKVLA